MIDPSRRSPLLLALAGTLLLQVFLIPLALVVVVGTPWRETLLGHVDKFLHLTQSADSWRPMRLALAYLAAPHETPIYEALFSTNRFQYPLSSLLFVRGLSDRALNLTSWAASAAAPMICAAIFMRSFSRRASVERVATAPTIALAALVVALSLTFYPILKAYTLGQIQTWINALAAVFVLSWTTGWRRTSGVVLGIMCLIKPTWALLLGWVILRKEWRAAGAALLVVAAGAVVTSLAFGLGEQLGYLRVLSFLSRRGEAFYANQSFNGLMNRALHNGSNLYWDDAGGFPEYNPAVYGVTVGTFLILAFIAVAWPKQRGAAGSDLDLGAAIVTLTITAPVAWEHHYGVLVPVYALLVPAAVRTGARRDAAIASAIAVSFFLCGQYFDVTKRFADTPLNLLQSYTLMGGLLLLTAIYLTMLRPAPSSGVSSPMARVITPAGRSATSASQVPNQRSADE